MDLRIGESMNMINNRFALSMGMIGTYCLIDFVLLRDIAGDHVFKILNQFLFTGSISLKGISLVYISSLAIWLFPTLSNQKLVVSISSLILVAPIIIALIWEFRDNLFNVGFVLPTIVFFLLLFIQWKIILKS